VLQLRGDFARAISLYQKVNQDAFRLEAETIYAQSCLNLANVYWELGIGKKPRETVALCAGGSAVLKFLQPAARRNCSIKTRLERG